MSIIRRALGFLPVVPDVQVVARFINEELKPLVVEMRSRINDMQSVIPLAGHAQGSEPDVADGYALVFNTTTGRPRFWNGTVWADL